MSTNDARTKSAETVHFALDNARAGKLDVVEPLFAEDFVLHSAEGLPYGGDFRGWKGYTDCLRQIKAFWRETKHVGREIIGLDDSRVIVHFKLEGQIAKNGQRVEMPVVAIWELRNGKIVRIRPFYFDTKRLVDLAAL